MRSVMHIRIYKQNMFTAGAIYVFEENMVERKPARTMKLGFNKGWL